MSLSGNYFPLPWWEGIMGRGQISLFAIVIIVAPPPISSPIKGEECKSCRIAPQAQRALLISVP
jgi:hypothetical protein